jgi:hypothetical protein
MLKVKHFRHPLRTLAAAREVFTAYLEMAILTARGDARFKEDVRYNPRVVQDGFVSHLSDADDTAILLRICQAYLRTGEGETLAKRAYEPTKWWKQVRQTSLEPVRRALASQDLVALGGMYRNFFRDPCSAGLIGVPFKMQGSYLGHPFEARAGRFFLSNALHRIDHWKEQTGNRFDLHDLAGPDVGNPFGVSLEGTLVRSGTESQHYSAQRVAELLPSHHAVISEIGGGFGGLAYYLLRDRPRTSYYDFDVSESSALASYYLIKSFPHLKFLLYGEYRRISESLTDCNVALLPVFELGSLAAKSVDLTFSSHTISGLTHPAMSEYLDQIARTTTTFFLYVGRGTESNSLEEMIRRSYPAFTLIDRRILQWNRQKTLHDVEVELLYQIS